MLPQCLGNMILVAGGHGAASLAVDILVILGLEEILGFFGSRFEDEPGLVVTVRDTFMCYAAMMDDPVSDRVQSLGGRLKCSNDLVRSPVLSIVRRGGIRSVVYT